MMTQNIQLLRNRIEKILSKKRFEHTVGVANAAKRLGKIFLPDKKDELICAALLHDIAKELNEQELLELISSTGYLLSDADKESPPVLHAYAAPAVIKRDFPDFADEEILRAVFYHTVGSTDMTLFDEIIFISDFIEDGREYESSIKVRADLFSRLGEAKNRSESLIALHTAVIEAIDSTLLHLIKKNKHINEKTVMTRNHFFNLIKQEKQNES